MNSVQPLELVLPNGTTKMLRFTLGAHRKISDTFGMPMKEALSKWGTGALPGILFALMYDEEGKPPTDVTLTYLENAIPADEGTGLLALVMSAASQGKVSKNDFEVLMKKAALAEQGIQMTPELQLLLGLNSTPSVPKSSESNEQSSGGASSPAKSTLESSNGNNNDESSSESTVSSPEP